MRINVWDASVNLVVRNQFTPSAVRFQRTECDSGFPWCDGFRDTTGFPVRAEYGRRVCVNGGDGRRSGVCFRETRQRSRSRNDCVVTMNAAEVVTATESMKQLPLRQPLWLSVAVEMAAVAEALPPEWSAERVPPGQYHCREGRAAVAVAAEVVYRCHRSGVPRWCRRSICRRDGRNQSCSESSKFRQKRSRNDVERGQQGGWLLMAHDA